MSKLKWIEIRGFRSFGEDPQRMDFTSPLAVAWGPNSQGKTSVAEAVEFLLTGGICRCELTASAQDEFADALRNAHLSANAPVTVTACFETGDGSQRTLERRLIDDYGRKTKCSSSIKLDGQEANPEDIEKLGIKLSMPPLSAPILFQHTLGYLFSASPKERSVYFKGLLEVADIEDIREAIAQSIKSLGNTSPVLLSKLQTCVTKLKKAPRLQELLTRLSFLNNLEQAFSETAADILTQNNTPVPTGQQERYEAVHNLLEQHRSKVFPVTAFAAASVGSWSTATESSWEAIEKCLQKAKEVDEETKRLTKLFSEVLSLPAIRSITSPIDCPVCASVNAITPERVQAIRSRVSANTDYDQCLSKAEAALRQLETCLNTFGGVLDSAKPYPVKQKRIWRSKNGFSIKTLRQILGENNQAVASDWLGALVPLLRGLVRAKRIFDESTRTLKQFTAHFPGDNTVSPLRSAFDRCSAAYQEICTLNAEYAKTSSRLRMELQTIIDKSSAVEGWSEFLELAYAQSDLAEVLATKNAIDLVTQQHAQALKEIDRAIESVLEDKFSGLSSEISIWWERLRPDEKTFFASVKQRPKARRTVDFKAGLTQANDRSSASLRDAIAIFSQSQLHCLGLAAFLARSLRESTGFMIFDDPVISSDEDYRAHFVCTVLEELIKSGQQVLMLTQDQRTWKDVQERYASTNVDVFQITRDTGFTKVAKTSDGLAAMLTKAEPFVRSDHPEVRKKGAEILRDALERFCKELLVKNRRSQGDGIAKISDYDGKTLGDLIPRIYPFLTDASHSGKLKVMERALNPGKHDASIPSRGEISVAWGDLKRFKEDYLK